MINKYKNLINNTLIFALGAVGSKLISFFLVPLYTNVLTRDQYGTADFVMTCSILVIPIISLVIQDAMLRYGITKAEDRLKVARNALIVLIFGTMATLLLLPVVNFYEPLKPWKWYLFSLIVTGNAKNIVLTYAKIKGMNKLYSIASVLDTLTLALVNIVLLLVIPCGVGGYLMANIMANVVPTIIVLFATGMLKDASKAPFDMGLFKQMLKYSVPLIANNLSWWLLSSADKIMLESYLSAADLGLYTVATRIPGLLSVVTTVFSSAWTISSIQEYDTGKDKTFYTNVFTAFSLAMNLGACFIIAITKIFMRFYVGPEFYQAWVYVPILVLGSVYFAYASFFGAIYGAVNKNIIVTFTTMMAGIINIVVNFILMPRIGIFAAAISTAVGYAAIAVFRILNSQKYFSFPIRYGILCTNLVIVLMQAILVSLDIAVYLVSFVALVLILVINKKDIMNLYIFLKSRILGRI